MTNDGKVVITLYLDDLLIFDSNLKIIEEIKSFLKQSFDIKDLGPVDVIMEIKFIRQDDK